MKITLDKQAIISGDSLTATASKFKAREYVRAFVFNVYGRSAATELSGGAIATKSGVATVNYGTNSLPVAVSEVRIICLRGEQSMNMACASFQFDG
jgi:preprotein translocase subunit SecD